MASHPSIKDGGLGPRCAVPYADGGIDARKGYAVRSKSPVNPEKGKRDFCNDDPDRDGDHDYAD